MDCSGLVKGLVNARTLAEYETACEELAMPLKDFCRWKNISTVRRDPVVTAFNSAVKAVTKWLKCRLTLSRPRVLELSYRILSCLVYPLARFGGMEREMYEPLYTLIPTLAILQPSVMPAIACFINGSIYLYDRVVEEPPGFNALVPLLVNMTVAEKIDEVSRYGAAKALDLIAASAEAAWREDKKWTSVNTAFRLCLDSLYAAHAVCKCKKGKAALACCIVSVVRVSIDDNVDDVVCDVEQVLRLLNGYEERPPSRSSDDVIYDFVCILIVGATQLGPDFFTRLMPCIARVAGWCEDETGWKDFIQALPVEVLTKAHAAMLMSQRFIQTSDEEPAIESRKSYSWSDEVCRCFRRALGRAVFIACYEATTGDDFLLARVENMLVLTGAFSRDSAVLTPTATAIIAKHQGRASRLRHRLPLLRLAQQSNVPVLHSKRMRLDVLDGFEDISAVLADQRFIRRHSDAARPYWIPSEYFGYVTLFL